MADKQPRQQDRDLEAFRALNESDDFRFYKATLASIAAAMLEQFTQVLSTPEDVAAHNERVGMLRGLRLALTTVEKTVALADQEERRQHP